MLFNVRTRPDSSSSDSVLLIATAYLQQLSVLPGLENTLQSIEQTFVVHVGPVEAPTVRGIVVEPVSPNSVLTVTEDLNFDILRLSFDSNIHRAYTAPSPLM